MDQHAHLEMESALQAVYFATRHLDLAATALDLIAAPPDARVRVAQARACASRALAELARCLPPASAASQLVAEPVPF